MRQGDRAGVPGAAPAPGLEAAAEIDQGEEQEQEERDDEGKFNQALPSLIPLGPADARQPVRCHRRILSEGAGDAED